MKLKIFILFYIAISAVGLSTPASMSTKDLKQSKPELLQISMAAPDLIVLKIQAQRVIHGIQVPYDKQPGDEISIQIMHRFIKRDGKTIGALVGTEGKIMYTPDKITGDTLDISAAMRNDSYRLKETGKGEVLEVQQVYRKSKPVDCIRPPGTEGSPMEHYLILKLKKVLQTGKTYTVSIKNELLSKAESTFTFDPIKLYSEAVHVNQVGFRGDDPVKLAFLSFWMGDGGNLSYSAGTNFNLVDEKTNKIVFSGKTRLAKTASEDGNMTKADIFELDFSGFSQQGIYRVSVHGVGCSYPFEISDDAWKNAFVKSMRGLYCQRSGIELGPPYTNFIRPRAFHPEDGVKVYISEPAKQGEDPLIRKLTPEQEAVLLTYEPSRVGFQNLKKNLTNQILPNAWGGYMDAGDFDRRPDHALLPMFFFDLAEMYPKTYAKWNFNIPESKDNVPDLVNEALWEVDFLRRLQQPDGSVFGGINSGEHPRRGECSWQESLPVMVFSRTREVAYHYTAIGARAALWFANNQSPEISKGYKESALKAFEWAEKSAGSDTDDKMVSARVIAAAELYRLTGDEKFNAIFVANTRFTKPDAIFYTTHSGANADPQGEAGWTYLLTKHAGVNKLIQQNIMNSLIRSADSDVAKCAETDFHYSGGKERNLWWSALSSPGSHVLCRAHFLTGKKEYLQAILNSALTGAGANPVNMCYVTGVGSNYPQHPLHEDAYNSNQKVYEGITVGGPIDPMNPRHANSKRIMARLYPEAKTWPATESYYDVFMYPPMNEFTVHQTMQSTSFVWGYLAGRK
jgi:endoglucanase